MMTLVSQCAGVLGSTGALQIKKGLGVAYVYYIIGGLVLAIAFLLCFGLKDIKAETEVYEKKESSKDKLLTNEDLLEKRDN